MNSQHLVLAREAGCLRIEVACVMSFEVSSPPLFFFFLYISIQSGQSHY
jgi:hypothetical protein